MRKAKTEEESKVYRSQVRAVPKIVFSCVNSERFLSTIEVEGLRRSKKNMVIFNNGVRRLIAVKGGDSDAGR